MNQSTTQFTLDVRLENQPPMRIDVVDTINAGLDPRNDLVLIGNKIKNRQMLFEKKGENLALHYLGNTNQTFLNSLPLEENKTYLLEAGDRIQLTGVEIIVRSELVQIHESQKIKAVIFNSDSEIIKESDADKIIYKEHPLESTTTRRPQVREKIAPKAKKISLLNLWSIKIYSLIVDVFVTYLILIVLLPSVHADQMAITITDYLSSLIFTKQSHSFFSFFIGWYLLSFAQTMVFGTTIGQFILGLRVSANPTFGKLILYRLKTFFFSLFLIPAQNSVKNNLFFKGIRKIGIFFIFIFILISPFLLPPPYNTALAVISSEPIGPNELRSRTIMSYSKDLQMSLVAELPFRYYLLPKITGLTKRGFELIDLKNNEAASIIEADDLSYEVLEEKLRYANPLYSTLHKTPLSKLTLKKQKELIESLLLLSPIHLAQSAKFLGPFFGSGVLIKKSLMNAHLANDMVLKSYRPETPIFFLSSAQQDYFYVLTPQHMRRFVVDSTTSANLLTVFEQMILTKLNRDSTNPMIPNNQNVTILEAQDAFLHGDEQTFLTYYVGIANSLSNVKIIHAEVDLTDKAKLAVIKNIEGLQKFIKNQNVYKSFNDIKNQLAPMEKPGEKR